MGRIDQALGFRHRKGSSPISTRSLLNFFCDLPTSTQRKFDCCFVEKSTDFMCVEKMTGQATNAISQNSYSPAITRKGRYVARSTSVSAEKKAFHRMLSLIHRCILCDNRRENTSILPLIQHGTQHWERVDILRAYAYPVLTSAGCLAVSEPTQQHAS